MIRISKSSNAPTSLANKSSYNGDDVQRQLNSDQHNKCYVCERICGTDYHIEHLRSRNNNDALKFEWTNLLLSCSYCNGRKSDDYDGILNPLEVNVEDLIEQRYNPETKIFEFTPVMEYSQDNSLDLTIYLLTRLYNGKDSTPKIREELFIEEIQRDLNNFTDLTTDWIISPIEENRLAIKESLKISKPILGLKYWIIQSNPILKAEFSNDIIWNKK